MKFRLLLLMILLAGLSAGAQETVINVAFTSDIHGVILPDRDAQSSRNPGSLAQVAALVRQWREQDPDLILIDCGDTIQGNPLMYYAARQMDQKKINPIISAMNSLQYDAMAVGNHEFNFGKKYLWGAERQAEFPFLSANTIDETVGAPAFKPYVVLERKGLRIGILGLTTDSIPNWELPKHIENYRFDPPETVAAAYVPILREKEQCDIVIVALHDGLRADPDAYSDREESTGMLISRLEGIDLLLTGHVHGAIPPRAVNNTYAATAPAYGTGFIHFTLKTRRAEDGSLEVEPGGEMVMIKESAPLDEEIVTLVSPAYEETDAFLDTVLATADQPIVEPATRHEDSPMVDLVHKAQLAATGADISLASLLPWGGFELEAGEVRIGDIFRFYQYENMLMTVEISGAQLREVLEWSARYFDGMTMENGEVTLILDDEISPYNADNAEGVSYRIDPTAPEGSRVRDLRFQGNPVSETQVFTVALNSYRRSGGGGYPVLKHAPVTGRAEKGVREILIDYIMKHGLSGAVATRNWYVAPDYDHFEKQ